MPYRKVGALEWCWYIVRQKIKDFLFDRELEDPYEPVYTKLPDGATLVTWRPCTKRKGRS